MKTRIQKWGNSLGLRIPKSFAKDLGLADDSGVELALEEGALVVRPDRERSWDLDSLLAGVTGENVHPAWEEEAGSPAPSGEGEDGGR